MQDQLFEMPEPAPPPRRGRPPVEITQEKQDLIKAAMRGGMSREAIATAIGLDPKTLRKYFSPSPDAPAHDLNRASVRLRKIATEIERIAAEILTPEGKTKGESNGR